jgi:putative transposase
VIISYKYRAHLDAAVEARLHEALDTCRWLYNKLLEECNAARGNRLSPTMQETQARIVALKDENPALKGVYPKVLQMVNYTLGSNIRALSETKKKGRKIGKLWFKSASRYRTLNYIEPVEMRPLHHTSVMQVLSMIAGKPRPATGAG